MSGAVKTTKKGFSSTKKVLSGKGNFKDFASMMTGGSFENLPDAPGPDYMTSPAQLLAQSGGASLLANIALGADINATLAGYFGERDFDSMYKGMDDKTKKIVDGVKNQLTAIQSNTELKNKAVQQVVDDFPNIVAKIGQETGRQFDEVTQGYVQQALDKVGAKYAAGGNLSSGAMAAASARAGADLGLQKFDRMQQMGLQGWQARYNETNALRNFQNLMTGQAAGQGFSAMQAGLARNQQTNMANMGILDAKEEAKQAQKGQMFGAIGSLAGTAIGAYYGGAGGAKVGSKAGGAAGYEAADFGNA